MKRLYPLIEVRWLDATSASHHTSWGDFDDFCNVDSRQTQDCHSVGYLIREDDDRLVVAAHLALVKTGDTVGQVSGTFLIPKCCIVSRRDLK